MFMYKPMLGTIGGASAGTLAFTGQNVLAMVVAATTLCVLGLAFLKVARPTRRNH